MKKVLHIQTILIFTATLAVGIYFAYWYISQHQPESAFVVKIPKVFNPNFTDNEFLRYFSEGNYVPLEELQNRNIPLPNVCGTLVVSIEKNGKIKLNMQNYGDLSNLEPLKNELNNVIKEREENKVYEPNSNKIVKTVVVKSNRSIKYGDVVKVIDAVKSSGAKPIVLQIDDLPN